MTTLEDAARQENVVALAADHGLVIEAGSVSFNDAGLDYQVAFATGQDAIRWVLRIPRRDDVSEKIADEARILGLVRDRLSVAVPDWRIQSQRLIAYPMLPGQPGLTLDKASKPVWHFDREDPHYARCLGRLIAELHRIDPVDVQAAGIPVESPAEVRATWRARFAQVSGEFHIAPDLQNQWTAWLADDHLWPEVTVFTHGELYPAHLLLDPDRSIRSVLDWTTAKVSDPALDFMYHAMISSPEAFQVAVDAYVAAGGHMPQHLTERCAAILAAGPLTYAAYALTTRNEEHTAAAAALLDPKPEPV